MELRPIDRIRAMGPVGVKRSASDVPPPVEVEGAGRMEGDSYGGSAKQQDRGLEEEDIDLEDDDDSRDVMTGQGKVDVVA
jgi:hypothetical protein